MAIYEFFCPTCRVRFEERKPMAKSESPAVCSQGHPADRLISTFALARNSSFEPVMGGPTMTNSCCSGGACACAAN